MKPAAFDYLLATDMGEAERALADGTAKPVAGNQSLGPMLNLRLARPRALVDLSGLAPLRQVEEHTEWTRLGAGITHAEIEDGEVPDPTGGWLRAAAGNIAYRAVRNRGTLGGSLAHADPAADWAIVMTGLGATAILGGAGGERRVAMEDFLTGPFATALRPGEILCAVEVPKPGAGARWGYWKFVRQEGEFAKASATILIDPDRGIRRAALGALGRQPMLLGRTDTDALIEGRAAPAGVLARALRDREPAVRALHVAALERALNQARGAPAP